MHYMAKHLTITKHTPKHYQLHSYANYILNPYRLKIGLKLKFMCMCKRYKNVANIVHVFARIHTVA